MNWFKVKLPNALEWRLAESKFFIVKPRSQGLREKHGVPKGYNHVIYESGASAVGTAAKRGYAKTLESAKARAEKMMLSGQIA